MSSPLVATRGHCDPTAFLRLPSSFLGSKDSSQGGHECTQCICSGMRAEESCAAVPSSTHFSSLIPSPGPHPTAPGLSDFSRPRVLQRSPGSYTCTNVHVPTAHHLLSIHPSSQPSCHPLTGAPDPEGQGRQEVKPA